MTDSFIKLSCTNCGAKLDIYDDMQLFACGHCGAEMEVQRRGGTVGLKVVTEAIGKVQIGTNDTAAGPGIIRLKEEAQKLSERRETLLNERIYRKKWGYVIGAALLLIGLTVVRSGNGFVLGMSILMAGIFTISYIRRNGKRVAADARELQTKIDVLTARIEDHAYQSKHPYRV